MPPHVVGISGDVDEDTLRCRWRNGKPPVQDSESVGRARTGFNSATDARSIPDERHIEPFHGNGVHAGALLGQLELDQILELVRAVANRQHGEHASS